MYYLLNSAVIAAGADGTYDYRTISQDRAVQWLRSHDFESRIGYPATQDYIQRISGVAVALSRDTSMLGSGDEALIVRPGYRIQDPGQKAGFTPKDDDYIFGILRRID